MSGNTDCVCDKSDRVTTLEVQMRGVIKEVQETKENLDRFESKVTWGLIGVLFASFGTFATVVTAAIAAIQLLGG